MMTSSDPQRDTDDTDFGSLSVEDDTEGTVDPADLAGTADSGDAETSSQPPGEAGGAEA